MTSSTHTEQGDSTDREPVLYGKILQQARKQKTMSVEDVAEAINVKAEIIEALESSATEGLPPPAFTQGYLRAYARHVEVSVDKVLQDFAVAVPHKSESELRARSNLPKEASSHTPAVKILTRILVLFIAFAVLYSIYSYYTNKVNHIAGNDGREGASLQITQDARLTDDGELLLPDKPETTIPPLLQTQPEFASLAETLQSPAEQGQEQPAATQKTDMATATPVIKPEPAPEVLPAVDEILIYADQDSWVEITDAAGRNLYYNMLREGQERELKGAAPFDIFFGNAPAVTLRVNDVDIDMKRFIRSNNVARFRVSTRDDEAVFHRR